MANFAKYNSLKKALGGALLTNAKGMWILFIIISSRKIAKILSHG